MAITLGQLIKWLESMPADAVSSRTLTRPHSYRGYYDQIAFTPTDGPQTAGEMLEVVRPCLDKVFEGYKGGDFTMHEHVDVNLAHYGNTGDALSAELLEFWFKAPLELEVPEVPEDPSAWEKATERFEALELAIATNRHDLVNLRQASEYHEGRLDDLEALLTELAARVDVIDGHLTRAVDSVEGIANELKRRIEDLELRVGR